MENIYGNSFYWWVGVVEDRQDPLFLGRCKVRIAGYHTPDTTELPTKDLPWAYPLQPITSAAVSGIGQTPIGPVEGTWVTGFFRDGDDCQEPIMMGTMGGAPGKRYFEMLRQKGNHGFQDANKVYPKESYLNNNEPDTNRLARNQQISETIVQDKDDSRVKNVEIAMGGSWDQPMTAYSAFYPYNHVFESESGHVIEIDDTKDSERMTLYHKAGTFVDVDRNGTMVKKIVGDSYEVYMRHNNVVIKGNANVTIEGNCNIYVKNNCNLEVDGDLKMHAHGDLELKAGKSITLASQLGLNLHSDLFTTFSSKSIISASPIITSPGIIPPSTIDVAGTSQPEFQDLFVPSRRETLTTDLDVLSEDYETNAEAIKSLQAEAIASGILTAAEVNAPTPSASEFDTKRPPARIQSITGCGEFGNRSSYPENLQISQYFTIASLTTQAAASKCKLQSFNGLSENEIACNLKALAENILDPIKTRYPNMLITSGFRNFVPRGGSLTSQHMKGQGVDLQFPGTSKAQYVEIAKWIRDNLNFDQMLLEYEARSAGPAVWIHCTFNKAGCRNTFGTFWNHKYAQVQGRPAREALVNLV
jgi:hypothetical protein